MKMMPDLFTQIPMFPISVSAPAVGDRYELLDPRWDIEHPILEVIEVRPGSTRARCILRREGAYSPDSDLHGKYKGSAGPWCPTFENLADPVVFRKL